MVLTEGRGHKSVRFSVNQQAVRDDLLRMGYHDYENMTDLLAMLGNYGIEDGTGADRIISGLLLEFDSVLSSNLRAGSAVSYTGEYLINGSWGFTAAAGKPFTTILAQDAVVTVDGGGAQARYDTIEIRPIQTAYDTQSRIFMDPVTLATSSANTATKIEYNAEVHILKGTEGAGVAPAHTAGWIKVAEVYVGVSASSIDQDDIKDVRDSADWTTEADGTKYKRGVADLFEDLVVHADILPGTDSTHSIGALGNEWLNGRFDNLYGTIKTPAQGDITSLGTLTGLTMSGQLDITKTGGAGYDFIKLNDSTDVEAFYIYYDGDRFEIRSGSGGGGNMWFGLSDTSTTVYTGGTFYTGGNCIVQGSFTVTGSTKTDGYFYRSAVVPTGTTQLNYDGYLYATRFYGGFYGGLYGALQYSLSAGDGMATMTAYDGSAARTMVLGTPSTCSSSTTNAVTTTSHTHVIGTAASVANSLSKGNGMATMTAYDGSAARTMTVGAGTGITVNTNDVALKNITPGPAVTTEGGLWYKGITPTAGQFDGSTTAPTGTVRLNYGGYLYATRFYGTIYTAAQAQITSVGILTGLTVGGTIQPSTGGTVNIGAGTTTRFNNVYSNKLWVYPGSGNFSLGIAISNGLSADRTLTLDPSDGNRTLTIGGNVTLNQSLQTTDAPTFGGLTVQTGYLTLSSLGTVAGAGRFDNGITAPTGTIRLNYGGNLYAHELYLTDALTTAMRIPRVFIQTTDPGTAAATGDLWIDTT